MHFLQRKYIDLIRQVSSKWVNWDPPIEIEVGAYGTVNPDTGDLLVEGNIYNPEFQDELDKIGVKLRMKDHPPKESPAEDDFTIATKGVKRSDINLGPEVGIAGIANASIKGQWQFERGKRDALLIMHNPRVVYLPPNVILEHLYKVPSLNDKWLVSSIHVCPAFSMYLSNKTGEKISLALVAQAPVAGLAGVTAGASGGFSWWTDTQSDLCRRACDKDGRYCYTPLFALKRPIGRTWRIFRDKLEPPPSGDQLWHDAMPPWQPLDEDGEEDPIDVTIEPDEESDF